MISPLALQGHQGIGTRTFEEDRTSCFDRNCGGSIKPEIRLKSAPDLQHGQLSPSRRRDSSRNAVVHTAQEPDVPSLLQALRQDCVEALNATEGQMTRQVQSVESGLRDLAARLDPVESGLAAVSRAGTAHSRVESGLGDLAARLSSLEQRSVDLEQRALSSSSELWGALSVLEERCSPAAFGALEERCSSRSQAALGAALAAAPSEPGPGSAGSSESLLDSAQRALEAAQSAREARELVADMERRLAPLDRTLSELSGLHDHLAQLMPQLQTLDGRLASIENVDQRQHSRERHQVAFADFVSAGPSASSHATAPPQRSALGQGHTWQRPSEVQKESEDNDGDGDQEKVEGKQEEKVARQEAAVLDFGIEADKIRGVVSNLVSFLESSKNGHTVTPPYGLPAASGKEIVVTVDHSAKGFGLMTSYDVSLDGIRVDEVLPGPVMSWNSYRPAAAVRAGDIIVAVNGLRGTSKELLGMLEGSQHQASVAFTIWRATPSSYFSLDAVAKEFTDF